MDKIPENIEILFFVNMQTPSTDRKLFPQLACHVQCRQPQAIGSFLSFWLVENYEWPVT